MTLFDLRRDWPSIGGETPSGAGSPAADDASMDVVLLQGFRGETVIGIHAGEQDAAQPVRIDVAAGVARTPACATDRIEDTIDYSAVRRVLHDLLAQHRHRLLEALAEDIAQRLLRDFGAHWARVVVVKPSKFDDVDAVGVAIERRRPAGAASRGDAATGSVLSLLGAGMIPGARSR